MAYTLESALDDPLIGVVDRNDDWGEYVVQIGVLTTPVVIKLNRTMDGRYTEFRTSHAIHTPVQGGPYRTSKAYDDDTAYALHRAIDGLTSYYKSAVQSGHSPSEDWLVPNA